jgi:LOB domain-containing protein 29
MTGFGSPCGACKFLRRKCVRGCVFAPYFCHEQGAAHFAAIHKVFGASNVSKLLAHLPLADRPEAAVTISYEAQARLRDPIYGCVAHIFALQQQVLCQSPLVHGSTPFIRARVHGCVADLCRDQVMTLQAQLASLKAQAAQEQGGVHDDANGYMGSAAEQLGYGYSSYNSSNGGGGPVDVPAAQLCAYSDGGHDSITALLQSDSMQQSLHHALEQAGSADDDGRQTMMDYEAETESSSFGAEESGWMSSSGYQDCEDLQSVAYAYLNHRS